MAERPSDPRNSTAFLNDTLRRLRELERTVLRLPESTDPLQTFENGSPLGETRFLDFGPGIQSTLIGNDFVRVSADAGEMVFDALVDAAQTTNESARVFSGIGEALTYLANTVGLTHAGVAVRNGTYTETANWATPGVVRLFGIRGMSKDSIGGIDSEVAAEDMPHWDWDTFRPSAQSHMDMDNIFVTCGTLAGGGGIPPFDALTAHNCLFDFTTTFPTDVAFCNFFAGLECQFSFTGNGGTARTWCVKGGYVDCNIVLICSATTSPTFILGSTHLFIQGGRLGARGTNSGNIITLSLPANTFIQAMDSQDAEATGTTTVNRRFFVNSGGRVSIHMTTADAAPQANWQVIATAAFESLELIGNFDVLTISGAHKACSLDVIGQNFNGTKTWDITGPAAIKASMQSNGLIILRGTGIAGVVSASGSTLATSTALSFIAADYNSIVLAANGASSSGTHNPYAFDASSDNNVLVLSGAATYPAAGTDAGAGNRVLPESVLTAGHVIEDEGVGLTQRANLNFVGAGVTVTDSAPDTIVTIPGGAGHVIQDESVSLAARTNLNFVGAGVTVTDDAGNDQTDVTISGGGGGGGDTLVAWVAL